MRIIFDLLCAQPIGSLKFHGGGEYTKTVFQYILERKIKENLQLKIIACYDFDNFIDEWLLKLMKDAFVDCICVKNVKDISQVVNNESNKDDIRFFAGMGYNYQLVNVNFPKNVVSIGVFHGLRVLEKPYDSEAWRYGTFKRRIHEFLDWVVLKRRNLENETIRLGNAISNFDNVVTVSLHSAYSIKISFGDVLRNKNIKVLYSPLKYVPESNSINSPAKTENYIMIVSADRWLKNSFRGICALDNLYSKGYLKGIRTKIYGNPPMSIRHTIKNKDKFDFFGYVSGDELEKAYLNCNLFLYPTLNEGFGAPPLEVMKYGKTCVVSAVSSLTEIYKDSVYYFNPYDIREIENRILMAIECPIDKQVIARTVNRIQEKQRTDLHKLSDVILGM